jgi:hypothetical protein
VVEWTAMALTRWLLLAFVPGLTAATAQEAPDWTPEEAGIPAFLRMIAGRATSLAPVRELTGAVARQMTATGPLPGVRFADGDRVELGGYSLRLANAQNGAAGEGFALYAWPSGDGAGTRTFVVTAQLQVLATDGMRPVYHGTEGAPEWNAAVAAGAPDTLAHVLAARGPGRDGQLWLPVAKSRSGSATVRVRGIDKGMERDTLVMVGAPALFTGAPSTAVGDLKLPADMAVLGVDGTATLNGIHTTGLHVVVRVERIFVPDVAVARSGDGFELSFDPERLVALRYAANESAAVATLRNIRSAQSQCQASGAIDADQDGVGEFGYFAELTGKLPLRPGTTAKMSPPVLSSALGNIKGGRVVRSGYVFQMFLPGKDRAWLAEADAGGTPIPAPDPQRAEASFRCYAWPVQHGRSGKRAFVVDERGDVRACDAGGRFDGESKPVTPDAAYGDDAARWGVTR